MPFDPLAADHWRTCLLPPRLTAADTPEAAAFFVRTYVRDLLFPGYLTVAQARPVVHLYAAGVGATAEIADDVLAEVERSRRDEIAAHPEPGDDRGFGAALDHLAAQGVAVRVGRDCCRDVGLEVVEREHAEGDRFYAVVGLADLVKVARAGRIDISFSYLDRAYAEVLTPELYGRASGGDRAAQATWMRTIDEAETTAGRAIAATMRDVGGLEVAWDGTARDAVHV
ncbi:MAG TPA: hypothetical protein VGE77_05600, partial [Nocardioides sp.]